MIKYESLKKYMWGNFTPYIIYYTCAKAIKSKTIAKSRSI